MPETNFQEFTDLVKLILWALVAALKHFWYVEMFLTLRDKIPVPFTMPKVPFILNLASDNFKLNFPRFLK